MAKKEKKNAIEFTFKIGAAYKINKKDKRATSSDPTEQSIVVYDGKFGHMHKFHEINSGWTTHRSDVQFLGMKIQEVRA